MIYLGVMRRRTSILPIPYTFRYMLLKLQVFQTAVNVETWLHLFGHVNMNVFCSAVLRRLS